MTRESTRRQFIQTTALTSAGFWLAGGLSAKESSSALEKVQFASIGIDGKGDSDSRGASRLGDMAAICDIDSDKLKKAARKFKGAEKFVDFREMLDKMGDKVDAVTVSTPDHTHAPAAAMAMRMGKHCFCQKPLTHTIYEARVLAELATEKGVATQMGNQGTSNNGLREAAAMLKAGVLGAVSEVHVWTNRPIWPQGGGRPTPSAVPANLAWDEWIGPAPMRPHANGYHPFSWRGYWDFGTGALGDMACHILNLPFMGLDLRDPISVEAESSGHNHETFPKWSKIRYEFAATADRPALTLFWYDGGKLPAQELFDGEKINGNGSLCIGEKGKLYSPEPYGKEFKLLGGAKKMDVDYVRSPGHVKEWVNAIKGGPAAVSNFPGYATPLTETVLLGNLAIWSGKKVDWDPAKIFGQDDGGRRRLLRRRRGGSDELNIDADLASLVKSTYREGYTL